MITRITLWLKSIPRGQWIKQALGAFSGALAGYIYYIKVGCVSGTCPITSNPYLAIFWGILLGYLIADMIKLPRQR